jgi:hypothetical protein
MPERLSATAPAHSIIASERAHRRALAIRLCEGMRVLDLDAEERSENVLELLDSPLRERFDAIVMVERFEQLSDPNAVVDRLARHATAGMAVVLAVPNTKALAQDAGAENAFGYEEAMAVLDHFATPTVLYQFLAEGSLIRSADKAEPDGDLVLSEHGEVEWAACYIGCLNLDGRLAGLSDGAYMQLAVAPQYNRRVAELERANRELWRENGRLARLRMGTNRAVPAEDARARQLEERVVELEGILALPRHKAVEQLRGRLRRQPLLDRALRRLGRIVS